MQGMPEDNKALLIFSTRVRQLMLRFQEIKAENNLLCEKIKQRDVDIARLEQEIRDIQQTFDRFKTAKMMTVTDGDVEKTKARLAALIRDVNKCITWLAEK